MEYKINGDRILEKRKELRIKDKNGNMKRATQTDLINLLSERDCHIGRNRLSDLENGKIPTEIKLNEILTLCEVLNCDLNYLLDISDYSTQKIKEMCEYTGLSEKALVNLHDVSKKNESTTNTLNNLIVENKDAFMGIIDSIGAYCINLLVHDHLNKARKEKELQEHHLNSSSLALMNCQQWINYIGHNISKSDYYRNLIAPYLKRIKGE